MKYETRKLSDLKLWDKNPRSIAEVDLERLKKLITKLGLFKPFLITPEGVILGGNMRFKACKELGLEEVPVSVVEAKTETKQLEYALADNDRAGNYDEQSLAMLVIDNPELNLEDYKIDLSPQVTLKNLMEKINPENYDDDFELPSGEKSGFQQITLSLADEQAELIKNAIEMAKNLNLETFDNQNNNGNAIYWICKQWQQLKT